MPQLVPGDLIFAALGEEDNLISAVVEGHRGARINHVGIVVFQNGLLSVLEAIDPAVRLTSLEQYAERSHCAEARPRLMFARLSAAYRPLIPGALTFGLSRLGVPYDPYYSSSPESLYCSELILEMFRHANNGVAVFPNTPLSFRDVQSGALLEDWVAHYAEVGREVPEGAAGSHPAGLSRDARLEVYHVEGRIPGYASDAR
ncbi:YiiX/YebB-like N1pC/P60 family cysteine hydrolase [Shimia sp. MMG029]|uniref:YiiX/YebB-like N1pC/P60 family cysteine hydrolase n=1 Tax=Shimia sp. MMG029 TaxID=3021978 RepID=UPI0022FED9AD|nr:YiiX/YebB-like N1pC/P60 family cysteine hydrolase [Shimia sp. MMG029]MDA5555996.1 YiiX/YebB-like N1pC/P60 family cysteine hydrolase [Shimia sp. MMG029]